jgi:hypothetical protein
MNVNIPTATLGDCAEYKNTENNYENTPKTIVISPLRVTMVTESSYKISFGCNFWKSCHNKGCSYCMAGMAGMEHE